MTLTNGLFFRFLFDETSGSQVTDLVSGTNFSLLGTENTNYSWENDATVGNYLKLTGSGFQIGRYSDVFGFGSTFNSSQYTIAVRYKKDASDSSTNAEFMTLGGGSFKAAKFRRTSSALDFYSLNGSGNSRGIHQTGVDFSNWDTYVVVKDDLTAPFTSGQLKFYISGNLISSPVSDYGSPVSNTSLSTIQTMGCDGNAVTAAVASRSGLYKEFVIWDRLLSDSEVLDFHNNGIVESSSPKLFNGTEWVPVTPKIYDGENFVNIQDIRGL